MSKLKYESCWKVEDTWDSFGEKIERECELKINRTYYPAIVACGFYVALGLVGCFFFYKFEIELCKFKKSQLAYEATEQSERRWAYLENLKQTPAFNIYRKQKSDSPDPVEP